MGVWGGGGRLADSAGGKRACSSWWVAMFQASGRRLSITGRLCTYLRAEDEGGDEGDGSRACGARRENIAGLDCHKDAQGRSRAVGCRDAGVCAMSKEDRFYIGLLTAALCLANTGEIMAALMGAAVFTIMLIWQFEGDK